MLYEILGALVQGAQAIYADYWIRSVDSHSKHQKPKTPSPAVPAQVARPNFDFATMTLSVGLALVGLLTSDLPAIAICLSVSCCALCYVCWNHRKSWLWRICSLLVVIAIFGSVFARVYLRITKDRLEDIQRNLTVEMGAIDPGARMHLLYTAKNNSRYDVSSYRATCIINKIMDDKRSAFVISPNGILGAQHGKLTAGGPGQTDRCYTDFMIFNGPVICSDVTISIDYKVDDISRNKKLRFIAARGNGPHWYEMSPDVPGDYYTQAQ